MAETSRATTTTPLPSPPPQGGRERTETVARLLVLRQSRGTFRTSVQAATGHAGLIVGKTPERHAREYVVAENQRMHQRGAEMGEKVAIAAAKVKEEAGEAALTSKIKAKMVLDDNIKARAIDVTTDGSTVTLAGTVRSIDEHDRAMRLASETAGVIRVVDHLRIAVR